MKNFLMFCLVFYFLVVPIILWFIRRSPEEMKRLDKEYELDAKLEKERKKNGI